MNDLIDTALADEGSRETLAEGAMILRGRARSQAPALLAAVAAIAAEAPFRRMMTPGGLTMSVAMTNCGAQGWVTDRHGYRYTPVDPQTGRPWPALPEALRRLAVEAAAEAGFPGFSPDVCLINRYEPGSKLSLHQDRDEPDRSAPIVSVSLGLPAVFLFGGLTRDAPKTRTRLAHGDIVVWGGPSRLAYHAVQTIKPGSHPATADQRINLTFRKAGPP
ncbi:alpha-ketoglutarate-dependent dioxygenase AlkB [Halothiobacillus diazotrophicus]|uniref:Alpha-ketoglutarate-dependent dioxygenase AlkB n=1 Tax=Halothiobacillus diazotrophicus TaxID=1860122 RepID=A0A191ZHI8_9GAMM|nr:DNA oxidative demethylase AlkB [Halothiobacillus diazotrophicus]ANJ67330.1 alpha-ketoglutarate-dependent dioxygenase AlkB [Halothiobacillus diazotrophicus]